MLQQVCTELRAYCAAHSREVFSAKTQPLKLFTYGRTGVRHLLRLLSLGIAAAAPGRKPRPRASWLRGRGGCVTVPLSFSLLAFSFLALVVPYPRLPQTLVLGGLECGRAAGVFERGDGR